MCSRNNQAAKLTERYTRTWRLLTLQRHTIRLDSTSGMAIVGSRPAIRHEDKTCSRPAMLSSYEPEVARWQSGLSCAAAAPAGEFCLCAVGIGTSQ